MSEPEMEHVAGHTFRVHDRNAVCEHVTAPCGIAWKYLKYHCDYRQHVGESGFAHVGLLNSEEDDQIERRRKREDEDDVRRMDLIWDAVVGVAKL